MLAGTCASNRTPIATHLPASEPFDSAVGKIITLARGHYTATVDGLSVNTTLRWTLTLTRKRQRP